MEVLRNASEACAVCVENGYKRSRYSNPVAGIVSYAL